MGEACSKYGRDEHAHRILMRKPVADRPLEKPRCMWDNYIIMDIK
jgi:hypothetical protein